MIVELGHYALVLALCLALVQSIVPLLGARVGDAPLMQTATTTALAQFAFTALSFAALTYAHVVSDFSVVNVVENSHTLKPLIYKITGVWGNHEGSMLLWVLILTIFGASVAAFGGNLPRTLKANVLAVQGWIAATFFLFILITSNPFARLANAPLEGKDLNPVLQDMGLAIHPPLLYLGYVGFSISFAFAIAALIDGKIDAAWARWVRPWTLAAWVFLTLGIAMGSYWAYYELGWGGVWFWDPVENASLMPWLAGTALLHSAVVMEKRNALKIWTVLLAILTFSLSLLGTFLVRSGVLTSVHAFATDPARGLFILGILVLFIGGGFTLFAARVGRLQQGGVFAPVSREGALVLNNILLTTACATVFTGTLYPLLLEAVTGEKISVGAPFFNMTFGPLMVPLFVAVPFGPLLAWKRGDLPGVTQRLMLAFGLGLAITLIVWLSFEPKSALAALGLGLAAYLLIASLWEIITRIRLFAIPLNESFARLPGLPRATFGTAAAHFGLAVTLIGLIGNGAYQTENIRVMKVGETTEIAGYQVTFDGVQNQRGTNYTALTGTFTARQNGLVAFQLEPEKRIYPARQMPTTESAIATILFSQMYITLGDPSGENAIVVRMWFKPLVTLIWLGALVMAFGGLLSLSDRRLRVGAPRPARASSPMHAELIAGE